jgi:hypothetical protein
VLPPFIVRTDWQTLALGLAVLSLFVTGSLAVTWAAAMRNANAATLRITQ